MRVNVYAEEITDRIELVTKRNKEGEFVGLRFYLELPVTQSTGHGGRTIHRGPFVHRDGDDDSSAVTFWGKRKMREALQHAIDLIDEHYGTVSDEAVLINRVEQLKARVKELEAQVVSTFDGEHPPTFRQGVPTHELEDLVTAEQCASMAARIVELEKQLENKSNG